MRFYEKEFNIDIPRNKSNHRYYTKIEIEKFLYIKSLKEKGLSLSQIKEILKSPEIILPNNEVAVALNKPTENISSSNENLLDLKNSIEGQIQYNFKVLNDSLISNIQNLLEDYLINRDDNLDKDALISEVARLKMKLKEKSYEVAQLREKVKKLENNKRGIFSRIFGIN